MLTLKFNDSFINKALKIIKKEFKRDTYLVGGAIRNLLLNRKVTDLDFVTKTLDIKKLNKISTKLKSRLVRFRLDDFNFIYRIWVKNKDCIYNFDFTEFQEKNLKEDLSKRDFTINTLCVNLQNIEETIPTKKIIDLFNGKKDLELKIIRHVKAENLISDPIRMLRAFRFVADLGFKIQKNTLKIIKKNKNKIKKSANERITLELWKIFNTDDSHNVIEDCRKVSLLSAIFPEISNMEKSPKKFYFHPNGLLEHSIEAMKSLSYIYQHMKKIFKTTHKEIINHLQEKISFLINRKGFLKFVTLFHDVAKPKCVNTKDGKVKFIGHEKLGAEMITDICQRLRFSNKEIETAQSLIKNHMRPFNLFNNQNITERAKYRLYRDLNENYIDLLLLSLADCFSYRDLKDKNIKRPINEFIDFINNLMEFYFERKKIENLPKIIDGHIIMEDFKLKPGKIIGEMLEIVKEAQLLGKIKTKEEAIDLLKQNLEKLLKKYKNDIAQAGVIQG